MGIKPGIVVRYLILIDNGVSVIVSVIDTCVGVRIIAFIIVSVIAIVRVICIFVNARIIIFDIIV
jgi:hypothetical protein